MKIKLVIILITLLAFTSCNNNSPENAIKHFFNAIEMDDYDKAITLATSESKTTINLLKQAKNWGFGDKLNKPTIIECETENDIAKCKCWEDKNAKPETISVKKIDGNWKVDMSITQSIKNASGANDINLEDAMNKLKDIDISKAIETISEGIEGVDSEKLNEQLKTLTKDFKGNATEAIDKIEEGLEKVKEQINK